MQNSKRLLVCDLDNTLYDWVAYFVPSFYAMIDAAVEIMACDREQLLDDMKAVHQRHHDSEHPFALLETKTVRRVYHGLPIWEVARILDPAFHAFNASRKRNLKLHDGVVDTLETLASQGLKLVAHTESKLHSAIDRLQRLDLLRHFAKIYCRERAQSVHPDQVAAVRWLKAVPLDIVRELSHHQTKPSAEVLVEICAAEGIAPGDAAYVGDSIARDILMAKRVGVYAIWAAYGASHGQALYDALVRVTHWTADEVAQESRLRLEAASVTPDYVARQSFAEVLVALDRARIGVAWHA